MLASSGGAKAAGVEFSIGNSSGIAGWSVAIANASGSAQKSASCAGGSCVIYGINQNAMSDGPIATATFQLAAASGTSSIPVQLTSAIAVDAQGNAIAATAGAGVISVAPSPQLTALTCSPGALPLNASGSCTVSFSGPALAATPIGLTSNSAALAVPGSVTMPAGQSSATFPVTSGTVIGSQSATVTAALNGASQMATIVVSAPVLTAVSATPSGGAGLAQTFTFVFSDTQSAANLSAAAFLIAPSLAYPNTCLLVYDRTRGTIQLEWDNVAGDSSRLVSSSTVLQNSQCSLEAASVTSNRFSTTISLALTFNATFAGAKNIYMYGADSGGAFSTGWVQRGTYVVTPVTPPSVTAASVTPNAGSGSNQTFSFVFSDSQTPANLSAAAFLIAAPANSSIDYTNACLVVYDSARGTIQLETDNAMAATAKPVASTALLENSQCAIGATSVTVSGLATTITLDITFGAAFSGTKDIYMYGADLGGAVNTGWVKNGVFTVTSAQAPVLTVVSATPSTGVGPRQTFTFVFSDSQSAANLSAAAFMIAPAVILPNSCLVVYDRARATIQLEWDNLAGADARPLTSAAPLQNSQCTVGAASVTTSGLTTIVTLDITFDPAFSGQKNIYAYGADTDGSINTGWVPLGSWTPF